MTSPKKISHDIPGSREGVEIVTPLRHASMHGGTPIARATWPRSFMDLLLDDEPGDPELFAGLPLHGLACDIARLFPAGFGACFGDLSYRNGHGDRPPLRGLFGYQEQAAAIILDRRTSTHETWAHELAHALDRAFLDQGSDAREAYANRLAPLLLRERPSTVVDARTL